MLDDILLILHFIGLALGFAGGIASGLSMRLAGAAKPEGAAALRQIPPIAAKISATGLVLLWLTGLALVYTRWNGFGALPALFWVKFAFVLALTALVGVVEATHARLKRTGDAALRGRLARLGPLSGLAALGALIFAVLAFH